MIKLNAIQKHAHDIPNKCALIYNDTVLSWKDYESITSKVVAKLLYLNTLSTLSRAVFISENNEKIVVLASAFSTLSIPFVGIDYYHTESIATVLKQLDCS